MGDISFSVVLRKFNDDADDDDDDNGDEVSVDHVAACTGVQFDHIHLRYRLARLCSARWRLGPVRRHDGVHPHHVPLHALRVPTRLKTL